MKTMLKKSLALLLCLVMCLSLFPATAFAAGEIAEESDAPAGADAPGGPQTDPADLAGEAISLPQTDEDGGQLIAAPTDDPVALRAAQDDTAEPTIVASGTCGDNLTWELDDAGTLTISGTGDMYNYQPPLDMPSWYNKKSEIRIVILEAGVTSIGSHAFRECSDLVSITLPESLAKIGRAAFLSCGGLTDITLPESVTSIDSSAFLSCSGLTDIMVPANVTSLEESAFDDCSNLTAIEVAPENTAYSSSDGILFNKAQTKLICCPDGKSGAYAIPEGTETIGDHAFEGCSRLTGVTIPNSVTKIDVLAFNVCSGLTSITIPDSVTSIGYYAFSCCSGLTSIMIPKGMTSLAAGAFSYCSALTSITIPSSVTSIGESVFSYCNALTDVYYAGTEAQKNALIGNGWTTTNNDPLFSATWHYAGEPEREVITYGSCEYNLSWTLYDDGELVISGEGAMYIPGWYEEIAAYSLAPWDNYRSDIRKITIEPGVTSIYRQAFVNCENLTEVSIPDSVTSIGYYAFYGSSSLTSISLPDAITMLPLGVFGNCTSLRDVHLPQNLTKLEGSRDPMYAGVFQNCVSLTELALPDSLLEIGEYVFRGCSGLASITLPNSVTGIYPSAFTGCSCLQEVHFGGSRGERNARIDHGWDGRDNEDFLNAYWYYAGESFGDIHSFAELKDAVAAYEASGDDIYVYYNGTDPFVIEESITLPKRVYFCADAEGSSVVIPEGVELIVSSGDKNAFYTENLIVEGSMTASRRAVVYRTLTGEVNWVVSLLASGRCGSADSDLYYELYDDGRLIVTGSGMMEGYPWCDYNADIRTVTLPEGLRTISAKAFRGCSNLQSISLPASLAGIYDYAFDGCTSLSEVNYAGSEREKNRLTDNGWSIIGNSPLYNASWTYGAETLSTDIHDFADLKALVEAYDGNEYYVFYNDTVPFVFEESITLPQNVYFCADADGSSALIPEGVSLTVESRVPNAFYVENLNVEGSMTAYRSAVNYRNLSGEVTWLRQIVASGTCGAQGDNLQWSLDDEGLLLISGTGRMADYDTFGAAPWYGYNGSIEHVTLEPGVTNVGQYAFAFCNMTEIDLPEGLTDIGDHGIEACPNLSSLHLPDSLVSIGINAFRCSALTDLVIPDSVTSIGDGAFLECQSLQHIRIPGSVTSLGNAVFLSAGLESVTLENGLTSIGSSCFSQCHNLISATLPESLTSIGDGAFQDCINLISVMIPENVARIGNFAFEWCDSLTDVYYAGTEEQRNTLTGSGWNTLGNGPLFNATWHYEVHVHTAGKTVVENTVMPTQTEAGHCDVVEYCAVCGEEMSRETRELPALGTLSVLDLPAQLTAIEAEAFAGADCEAVLLPAGVKSIGSKAFENCAKLRYVYFPAGIEIAPDAFEGCEDLLLIRTK